MSKDDLVLLDFWVSPFSLRVKIVLEEKGLSYEAREEDLFGGKSDLLLKSNPIYEKVPVLLHNGKPVVESSNIVYYIDETWTSRPLLPALVLGFRPPLFVHVQHFPQLALAIADHFHVHHPTHSRGRDKLEDHSVKLMGCSCCFPPPSIAPLELSPLECFQGDQCLHVLLRST